MQSAVIVVPVRKATGYLGACVLIKTLEEMKLAQFPIPMTLTGQYHQTTCGMDRLTYSCTHAFKCLTLHIGRKETRSRVRVHLKWCFT